MAATALSIVQEGDNPNDKDLELLPM
jgi:hypothetical protein